MDVPKAGYSLRPEDRLAALADKAEGVAGQFEDLFVKTMVESMRKTSELGGEGGGMFGSGVGSDTYAGWFDANVAGHVSKNGGIGIREVLLSHMKKNGQVTADALHGADGASAAGDAEQQARNWRRLRDASDAVRKIDQHDMARAHANGGLRDVLP